MAKLSDAVAPPGFKPLGNQTALPDDMYEGRSIPVQPSADLERIKALPRRPPIETDSPEAAALVEYVTAKYARHRTDQCRCAQLNANQGCLKRLLPIQAWGLHELSMVGGLIASAGVGSGKSILWILAPLAMVNSPMNLLLVPSGMLQQIEDEYEMLAEHFRVPSLVVWHAKGKERPSWIVPGAPVLHVVSYNRLSQPEESDFIERHGFTSIIADEVDALSDVTSARTIRLFRYKIRNPHVKFVGGTGSLTSAKISDYALLSYLALGENSPVPYAQDTIAEWGRCLDASKWRSPPGALMDLCREGEEVRIGYRRRLRETMGFITTTDNKVVIESTGEIVRLQIREISDLELPPIIVEALRKVRIFQRPDTLAPDGKSFDDSEIADPMEQARCAAEVACGCFYRWIFPRGEKKELIKQWFEARKWYFREVRAMILEGAEFLDSEGNLEQAAMRYHGDIPPVLGPDGRLDPRRPMWASQHWPRWRDIRDQVKPESEAVRLSDYLVRDAAEWGERNRGIIWYGMKELGQWISQFSGYELHAGGSKAAKRIKEITKIQGSNQRAIVASIASHGRGRNGLQFIYDCQVLVNMLSSSRMNEQLQGRLHRRGQKSNLVTTDVYTHVPELRKSFKKALREAIYVNQTLGADQKILIGYQGDLGEDDDE